MRIYLIGYMYCGKTTVGQQLAKRLNRHFIDLDQAIEARYHTTISIFFQKYGESLFRKVEQQMLHDTEHLDDVVISTGGGTPCFEDNMQWINDHGSSFYLKLSEQTTCQRMTISRKRRPTVMSLPPYQREEFIHSQLTQRLPTYQQAHHIIEADGLTTDEIVDIICEIVQGR
ncbi:MAG: shikimate kinase [Bacteroidales bacterium]|nr:shikimate kinase [Bacteroidales bacterium]